MFYRPIALFAHFLLWTLSMANVEEEARAFLDEVNKSYNEACRNYQSAAWDYGIDTTDEKQKKMVEAGDAYSKMAKPFWEKAKTFPWRDFQDQSLFRQFESLNNIWTAALPDEKSLKYNEIVAQMSDNFSSVQVCDFKDKNKCDLNLEPEITDIMANSRDEAELNYIWHEWMNKAGKPVRPLYPEYVNLYNEAAKLNGFATAAELWLSEYYNPNMEKYAEDLLTQLQPLYLNLYTYIRRKLREKYGEDLVSKRGLIPVHLTGNIWGQTFEHLADFTLPFPDVQKPDLTKALVDQGYTVKKMYEKAEEFYISIGLSEMKESFWQNSVFERIPDRAMDCQGSAWDMCDGENYRIVTCSEIKEEDFFLAYYLMGVIEYQMQYAKLPYLFRGGANPAFRDAIGELIPLSVNTEKHLNKIGLLPAASSSREADLNHLFRIAAEKIAFLPFGYTVDAWRLKVFRGEITPENYNCKWWELVGKFQGMKPPEVRTEDYFDPAAKFHISNNVEYISYFFGFALQFQFHEALCTLAGEYDPNNAEKPLRHCDIHQNQDVGALLKKVMELGSSKPWEDVLEMITGSRIIDASAVMHYFAPITDWLKEDNEKNGEFVGWEIDETACQAN